MSKVILARGDVMTEEVDEGLSRCSREGSDERPDLAGASAEGCPPQPSSAARAVALTKVYGRGDAAVRAFDDVSVEFGRRCFSAVMGPSGSGKSTLMHCMAGLDRPTSGSAFVGDQEIGGLSDAGLTDLRRDRSGSCSSRSISYPRSNASAELLAFLRRSVGKHGQSIVMVTHDPRAAAYADRVVFLADGRVVSELAAPTTESVLEAMKMLGG